MVRRPDVGVPAALSRSCPGCCGAVAAARRCPHIEERGYQVIDARARDGGGDVRRSLAPAVAPALQLNRGRDAATAERAVESEMAGVRFAAVKRQCRGDAHGRKPAQALKTRLVIGVEVEEADERLCSSLVRSRHEGPDGAVRAVGDVLRGSFGIDRARPSGVENLRRGMESVPRSIDISASTSRKMRSPSASSASLSFSARSIPAAAVFARAAERPPRKRL